MPTRRKRHMVNLPDELASLAEQRAKALHRPIANYLEWLVARDVGLLGPAANEDPDKYHAGTPETTLPAEKAVREELARRTQPAQPPRTPQSNPPLSGRK